MDSKRVLILLNSAKLVAVIVVGLTVAAIVGSALESAHTVNISQTNMALTDPR